MSGEDIAECAIRYESAGLRAGVAHWEREFERGPVCRGITKSTLKILRGRRFCGSWGVCRVSRKRSRNLYPFPPGGQREGAVRVLQQT